MALIKCRECQKEISDRAVACPHCGTPVTLVQQKQETGSFSKIVKNEVGVRLNRIGGILFGLAVMIAAVMIIVALIMLEKGGFLIPIAILVFVQAAFIALIVYVVKTLFNGFAENLQILHDIRNDIRNNNNK